MSIVQYYQRPSRSVVGIFNEEPTPEALSTLGNYEVRRIEPSEIQSSTDLINVAAVVFIQDPERPNKIVHEMSAFAHMLLWHDCRVFVRVLSSGRDVQGTPNMRALVYQVLEDEKLPASGYGIERSRADAIVAHDEAKYFPMVRVLDEWDDWTEVSRILREFPPGDSPSLDLEIIDGSGANIADSFDTEHIRLLQRAFHDCRKLELIKNSEGLSGANTWRVLATRKRSYVGDRVPYEYFAKISKRAAILKEFQGYQTDALDHIPFHLNPRLQRERCELGSKHGIVVTDYVRGSETLRACARDGRAGAVIASLFNTTLRAWFASSTIENFDLRSFLKERIKKPIPEHRRKLIQELGSTKLPRELSSLVDNVPTGPTQVGVVHGDLHSLNVMTRGSDAVLIDFDKIEQRAPLLFDLASLEAGLMIGGFIDDTRQISELKNSITELYDDISLLLSSSIWCEPAGESVWFFECVRQIRMQAIPLELVKGHYAAILGVVLLKKACNENVFNASVDPFHTPSTEEQTRALAYVIGESILIREFENG